MTGDMQNQLSRLRISVITEASPEGFELVRYLQRLRTTPKQIWPMPELIGDGADLVFCDYARDLSKRLAWAPGEAKAALIVLLPQGGQFNLREVAAALPDSVLYRPYFRHAIDVSIALALDHFGYARRQRQRIARLEENIRALRDVEKA